LTIQKVHKEIVNLYELSSSVQIFWRDTNALYDEQIETRPLFTFKHWSANI